MEVSTKDEFRDDEEEEKEEISLVQTTTVYIPLQPGFRSIRSHKY